MVSIFVISFLLMVNALSGQNVESAFLEESNVTGEVDLGQVGEHVYWVSTKKGRGSYQINNSMQIFERENSINIKPAFFPKIAIKLDTQYAPGISTKKALVIEILEWLESKGYSKNQIMLFDRDREGLRNAGFWEDNSDGNEFLGHEVLDSSQEGYYQNDWFHDSPLPPTPFDRARFILKNAQQAEKRITEERRSFLPAVFLSGAYWINLAVPMDDPFLGLDGASANLTLGSISNYGRFLNKKTLSAATVAEVLAIPEIWEKRLFTILDLTTFQVANGQRFDAKYSHGRNAILLSRNPVAVDYAAWKFINKERVETHKLTPRRIEESLLFRYSKELGLGSGNTSQIKVIE